MSRYYQYVSSDDKSVFHSWLILYVCKRIIRFNYTLYPCLTRLHSTGVPGYADHFRTGVSNLKKGSF